MQSLTLAARRFVGVSRPNSLQYRWRAYSTQTTQDLSDGEREIFQKLTDKFSPTALRVQDVSGGCGSFYTILIASEEFKGLSTVKQHKLVTQALKSEIAGIHGLQLKTIIPE